MVHERLDLSTINLTLDTYSQVCPTHCTRGLNSWMSFFRSAAQRHPSDEGLAERAVRQFRLRKRVPTGSLVLGLVHVRLIVQRKACRNIKTAPKEDEPVSIELAWTKISMTT